MENSYARPGGRHYHMDLDCRRLSEGKFEKLGFALIDRDEAVEGKLDPCRCVWEMMTRRRTLSMRLDMGIFAQPLKKVE